MENWVMVYLIKKLEIEASNRTMEDFLNWYVDKIIFRNRMHKEIVEYLGLSKDITIDKLQQTLLTHAK